jgi:hypothetical protein
MFFPLNDITELALIVRETSSSCLAFLSLGGGSATSWRSYSLVKWCFLLLEGLQLGIGLMFFMIL